MDQENTGCYKKAQLYHLVKESLHELIFTSQQVYCMYEVSFMIDPLQCTIGGVHYFLWNILF